MTCLNDDMIARWHACMMTNLHNDILAQYHICIMIFLLNDILAHEYTCIRSRQKAVIAKDSHRQRRSLLSAFKSDLLERRSSPKAIISEGVPRQRGSMPKAINSLFLFSYSFFSPCKAKGKGMSMDENSALIKMGRAIKRHGVVL